MGQVKIGSLMAVALASVLMLAGCGGEPEEVTLSDAQEKAIVDRIAPVGQVAMEGSEVAAAPVAAAAAESRSGQAVYDSKCMICHASGTAGAPKLGDVAAWTARITQGNDALYDHAINGFNGMPAKGLCMDCSDEELQATVDYMVSKSQ
jgi:cytochrome c5